MPAKSGGETVCEKDLLGTYWAFYRAFTGGSLAASLNPFTGHIPGSLNGSLVWMEHVAPFTGRFLGNNTLEAERPEMCAGLVSSMDGSAACFPARKALASVCGAAVLPCSVWV